MKKFLQQVAEQFYFRNGDKIGDLCFVFPNRRSSLFFQKYLGQCSDKPLFSPTLLTINDLFGQLSGLRLIDKIDALYTLYRHYSELTKRDDSTQETFDEFVFWGDILLNDFDDIDKYRVDARSLFSNIKELKDLDSGYEFLTEEQQQAIRQFWGNFLIDSKIGESAFDKKKVFRDTWGILYRLYSDFREELLSKGEAYEGMIYRYVADTLDEVGSDKRGEIISSLKKYSRIVFVGQNALNKCEKALLNLIRDELDGDFYWDYYGEMITDTANKSSLFMKDNVMKYPSQYPLIQSDNDIKTNYEVISVASATGQTGKVSSIVAELSGQPGFKAEDTAIVLPDENLLLPMLNAIPDNIRDINVTMGFPLSHSNVSSFLSLIDRLQTNKRGTSFYHNDVISLLDHPFFGNIEAETSRAVKKEIVSGNMIFPDSAMLRLKGELYKLIFRSIDDANSLAEYQLEILQFIQKYLPPVEKEFIYHYYRAITRIRDLKIPMQPLTYLRLLKQIVSTISIPFKGEPLRGLQIMGPLETRALDFKNIIILSVNEGVFPSKSVSSSFIPYNLRKGFDLPNYEFQDSISAYHFYRSIYRAENVILLYDSRTEGMQSGEVSRYIKQLKYHYKVDLKESVVTYTMNNPDAARSLSVVKTSDIIRKMEELYFDIEGKGSFSASSLNTYLNCPLQFYYKFVENIEEVDDVVEQLDSSLFGTIFHNVLNLLYRPLVGQIVDKEQIVSMRKNKVKIEELIDRSFLEEGKIKEISGQNIINKQLIIRLIDKTLEVDATIAPFTLKGTEVKTNLALPIFNNARQVRLFGIIDRMDSREQGKCRIIDYKTGSVGNRDKFKEVVQLFDTSRDSRPDIAFQLLLYALLFTSKDSDTEYIPCVYAMRDIFSSLPKELTVTREQIEEFKTMLTALIEEIFNPQIPFSACNNGNTCEYCIFKQICNR